jgi:hypothetical protein
MNRRELIRKTLFGAAGTVAATSAPAPLSALEFPENFDASKELAKPEWRPAFFSDHQNETLIIISDLMIPETDTPGAKAALVNRFLDLLLAAEKREAQQSFLNSLSYLDGEARARYGDAFRYIPQESQIELLRLFAYPNSLDTWGEGKTADQTGHAHFANLKGWITRVFFSSEAGMKALGWDGEVPHGELKSCDHESEQKKAPARAF